MKESGKFGGFIEKKDMILEYGVIFYIFFYFELEYYDIIVDGVNSFCCIFEKMLFDYFLLCSGFIIGSCVVVVVIVVFWKLKNFIFEDFNWNIYIVFFSGEMIEIFC